MAKIIPGKKLLNNQIIRFVLSSGVGFLADISAFYLFYNNLFTEKQYAVFSFFVSNYLMSLFVSFYLGVVINFIITRYFVFTESTTSFTKQFVRFSAVAIIGFFANLGVLELLVKDLHMYPPVARIAAALSLFFASFFVHKLFSFSLSLRNHEPRKNHPKSN